MLCGFWRLVPHTAYVAQNGTRWHTFSKVEHANSPIHQPTSPDRKLLIDHHLRESTPSGFVAIPTSSNGTPARNWAKLVPRTLASMNASFHPDSDRAVFAPVGTDVLARVRLVSSSNRQSQAGAICGARISRAASTITNAALFECRFYKNCSHPKKST